MATTLSQAVYDAWWGQRPGTTPPDGGGLSVQVSEIVVGDYLPSVRGTVETISGTGTTSTSTRTIGFRKKNSDLLGSVTWLATTSTWVGR